MPIGQTLTAAAYFVGAVAFWMAARQRKLATEGVAYLAMAAFVGGVLGAKMGEWALGNGALWGQQPLAVLEPQLGGRTILGGVLGGWIAVAVAKKRLGIRRSTGDLFAFALPWGEAVGRIGCWFNGCCFGALWDGPCAVWQHEAWRIPTQFLSALTAVGIGIIIWSRRGQRREGEAWHLYLALWGVGRFVIEFGRDHPFGADILSPAQWIALVISAYGIMRLRRDRPPIIGATA